MSKRNSKMLDAFEAHVRKVYGEVSKPDAVEVELGKIEAGHWRFRPLRAKADFCHCGNVWSCSTVRLIAALREARLLGYGRDAAILRALRGDK